MKRLTICTLLAIGCMVPGPARADHRHGCPGGPVNFGGGSPEQHNWINVCTPAANAYFFGTFGTLASGDPSGMCGYLVVDGNGPVDAHAGLAGDMQAGRPHPIPVAGAGDFADDHAGVSCHPA